MAPRPAKPFAEAIDDIDAQIARLQEKKKALRLKRIDQIAKIVADAGLADVNSSDEELLEAFKALTARFRGKADTSSDATAPTA